MSRVPLLQQQGGSQARGPQNLGRPPESHATQVQSRILQLPCKDIAKEALALFSSVPKAGAVPLVLIPEHRPLHSFTLSIPTGCSCLLQRYGKDVGIAPPGLHFMPPHYRIAYVVTQQACTYQAPVKECPTADNVRVSVEIVVVFMIRDPLAFVKRLGAPHFDLMLNGSIQEGIRILVRSQTFDTVYYLRGSRAESMITLLNQKFQECGVVFSNVTVRSVSLPMELQKSLEHTTELRKHMEKMVREQEFQLGEIRRESEMTLVELKRNLERTIVTEQGKKTYAQLEREQKKVKADEEKATALIQAHESITVKKLEIDAELQRAKTETESYKIEALSKVHADSNVKHTQADVDFQMEVTNAEAEKAQLVGDAKAVEFDAAAEAENAERYVAKRSHAITMKEREILAELAASRSIRRITGSEADNLIDGLTLGALAPKDTSPP